MLTIEENKELREEAARRGRELVMEEFNFDHYVIRLKELIVNELQVNRNVFSQAGP